MECYGKYTGEDTKQPHGALRLWTFGGHNCHRGCADMPDSEIGVEKCESGNGVGGNEQEIVLRYGEVGKDSTGTRRFQTGL